MNWKTLFNPFLKFDEKTLFIAGIVSITIVFLVGYAFGLQTDSLFHFRFINIDDSVFKIILSTLTVYAISIAIFFAFGKIINKKTRLIDIVNPIFISQFTVIFILLLLKIPLVAEAQNQILASAESKDAQLEPTSLLIFTVYTILTLAIAAYGIAIFFNGFKTATNMKNWHHNVLFAIILFTLIITMQLF